MEITNKNKISEKLKMSDIQIKSIDGIEFDKILGFTADTSKTTLGYLKNGKERTLTIESEAVEIEFKANV